MAELPNKEAIEAAAQALGKKEGADILLMNGACDFIVEAQVISLLKERRSNGKKRASKVIFVLTTPGGIPEVAYRIARALQNSYETIDALIGGWCKSAGTLCVIAANNIIMGDDAELGPLDIQLARRDEINERDSGLVIEEALDNLERYAFQFFDAFMRQIKDQSHGLVTLKTASEISSNVTKGLFEPIYRQIDPQKIGEVARSMAVGEAYGSRLNLRSKNLKPGALRNLLMGYPSHGFVIDKEEANFLFRSVKRPTSEHVRLLTELGELCISPCSNPVVSLFKTDSEEEHDDHEQPENPAPKKVAKKAAGGPGKR